MTAWLGREVEGRGSRRRTCPRVVYEHTHVVLNGGAVVRGDPERVRAAFSIPREKLSKAREACGPSVSWLR